LDFLYAAKELCRTLREAGHTAYFAGGYVRDSLLGIPSQDIDIATDADPDEITALFPDHVLVGAHFGVVLVMIGSFQFEVATFRKDLSYKDGRHPEEVVLKSTPEEDAARRDFTINGMFYDPETEKVLDYVGGRKDLENKIIRTIGSPHERFLEDRLRMLRAVRFAARFGFSLAEETRLAIRALAPSLIPAVSMERIWLEFSKMHADKHFPVALSSLYDLGLLGAIFPPLQNISPEEFAKRSAHFAHFSGHVPTILFLVELFDENDSQYVRGLAQYLKISNIEGAWIETMLTIRSFPLERCEPYDLAYLFANKHFEVCFEVICAKMVEPERKRWQAWYVQEKEKLEFFVRRIHRKEPLLSAEDLVALGIAPGKEMGRLLRLAEKISINQNIKEKEQLVQRLIDSDLKPKTPAR
jgi:poly(A) polymerase